MGTERCLYQIGLLRRLGPKDSTDLLQKTTSGSYPNQSSTILPSITLSISQPLEGHFPAGRGYAHQLSAVRAKKHAPVSHQVALCYLDLVGAVLVWESLAYLGHVSFELRGEVGNHKLVEDVEVPLPIASTTLLETALFSPADTLHSPP